MRVSTIMPGIMVALTIRTRGNVNYSKVDLENNRTEAGEARARWETTRTIADPAEFEKAQKTRSAARALISAKCSRTTFGLIALKSREAELEETVGAALALIRDFNEEARMTRLELSVMYGQIAADDEKAIKAMNSEMRDIIDDMEAAVRNIDAEAIRKAAIAAKSAAKMLNPEVAARVQSAIAVGREFATRISAAANVAAVTVDTIALEALSTARASFLDLSDTEEVKVENVKVAARIIDDFADDPSPDPTNPRIADKPEPISRAGAASVRQLEL
jgi:hypothetical protein